MKYQAGIDLVNILYYELSLIFEAQKLKNGLLDKLSQSSSMQASADLRGPHGAFEVFLEALTGWATKAFGQLDTYAFHVPIYLTREEVARVLGSPTFAAQLDLESMRDIAERMASSMREFLYHTTLKAVLDDVVLPRPAYHEMSFAEFCGVVEVKQEDGRFFISSKLERIASYWKDGVKTQDLQIYPATLGCSFETTEAQALKSLHDALISNAELKAKMDKESV